MFFFKNHAKNETGRLVPGLFLFFKKALYDVKASGFKHSFNPNLGRLFRGSFFIILDPPPCLKLVRIMLKT